MSFALEDIRALAPVARVVVAATRGSVPREVGAAMHVTAERCIGTIGGGALEFDAIARARTALVAGQDRIDRIPLGPGLGQCCGGTVTLLTEVWDTARLEGIEGIVARPVPGNSDEMPFSVSRLLAAARSEGRSPVAELVDGWMVEPLTRPERDLWVWGAGHVGRAIVDMAAGLPDVRISWADSDAGRFPGTVPSGVERLIAANPAELVTLSPRNAEHLVLTYSHALDLDLCHRILARPFRSLGLIGSATKWARFRSRLIALGHPETQVDRIMCPIGDPGLGKHPQAIAVGVAADVLRQQSAAGMKEKSA